MTTLFEIIKARLTTLPGAGYIDKDRGQLDRYETSPDVPFPCTLIKIVMPSCETISRGIQQCRGTVTVRYASDAGNQETSSLAPDHLVTDSLAYCGGAQAIYKSLQDYTENGITDFDRVSDGDEDRTDFDVIRMVFNCGFVDSSAAED